MLQKKLNLENSKSSSSKNSKRNSKIKNPDQESQAKNLDTLEIEKKFNQEMEEMRNEYEKKIREMEHLGLNPEEREELVNLRNQMEGNIEEKRSIKIQRNAEQQEMFHKKIEWNQEKEKMQNMIRSLQDDLQNVKSLLDQQNSSKHI